ncbi:hypothetical protein [Dyadobacter sp. LHD-138]|nr:hypothetical protein [Dyadobacter sp. LHD-138]MDQ6482016.1 hypothetical protein [Dyadobacter sp. LHD-138]
MIAPPCPRLFVVKTQFMISGGDEYSAIPPPDDASMATPITNEIGCLS